MRSPATPSEVRALTVLDTVSAGCRALPVPNDHNAPHLRRDEVVIRAASSVLAEAVRAVLPG